MTSDDVERWLMARYLFQKRRRLFYLLGWRLEKIAYQS